MPDSLTAIQQSSWVNFQNVSNKWFHNPDFIALRACLATAKSLDLPSRPVWLMLIAPSSCGKSDFYLPCASAYVPSAQSDEVSLAGLMSGSRDAPGEGVLKKLSPKGLWLFSDFTVLLNLPEEKRNSVMGAHRRIYDGEYSRDLNGQKFSWRGRIHVVAACTPAIERFHRVNADLGERMIQVRVHKQEPSDAMLSKMILQAENHEKFHLELTEAAGKFLRPNSQVSVELPFDYQRLLLDWSEFVAVCRVTVGRNYKDEITSVGHEEGIGRVFQQLVGLIKGDAALMGQTVVDSTQIPLIRRIAYDCLPWARRAVLLNIPPKDPIKKADLKEMSGISHRYTFDQVIEELSSIGVLTIIDPGTGPCYSLTEKVQKLIQSTDSKGCQLTTPP